MFQETSHSGSVPGSPHTRRALLASLGHIRFQGHRSLGLIRKQTDDARVDKSMFALIFTRTRT